MIIAIDLDGVLRDFIGQLIKQFKQDYPTSANKIPQSEDDITRWALSDFFPKGWNKKELSKYWRETRPDEIYGDADPYPQALKFMKQLSKYCKQNKHKLIIITSAQHKLTQKANWKWLKRTGVDKLVDEIHMKVDKYKIPGDILLDDYIVNLEKWSDTKSVSFPGQRIAVAFNRPWNQQWDRARVKNYDAFLLFLKTIDEYINNL